MAADYVGPPSPAAAFEVLAGIFARELRAELLELLADGLLADLVPEAQGDVRAERALADLARSARATDPGRLAAAFAALFLGVGGARSAPPFASVYRSPTGRLLQEPASEMADLLRRADSDVAATGEPPDHLAVQLALVADLLQRGDPDGRTLADEVRTMQLRPWLSAFAGDCVQYDPTGFYAAAARLTAWLVDQDDGHGD